MSDCLVWQARHVTSLGYEAGPTPRGDVPELFRYPATDRTDRNSKRMLELPFGSPSIEELEIVP